MATKCDIIYIVHQFSGLVLAYFLATRVLDFLKLTMLSAASPAKVGSTQQVFFVRFSGWECQWYLVYSSPCFFGFLLFSPVTRNGKVS